MWDLQIPGCKTRVDKDQIREVVLVGIILCLNLMENFSTCLLNASMEAGALTQIPNRAEVSSLDHMRWQYSSSFFSGESNSNAAHGKDEITS